MVALRYQNEQFELNPDETVLDCLTRHGISVPSSCRAGLCQTCLMRAEGDLPPPAAQAGLKDSQKAQGYFLACVCRSTSPLAVALPDAVPSTIPATVRGLELLNDEIMRVMLDPRDPIEYRPGQFLRIYIDDSDHRSYSLASVPERDRYLQLHVRHLPGGRLSGWIHKQLRPGQQIAVGNPAGDCFYVPGRPDQELLLIGTGSGLAPLYGIVRDALTQGHRGTIRLFHGSRDRRGLYLVEELSDLSRQFPQFDYVPCLSGPDVPEGFANGRPSDIALREVPNLKGWRIFLCGHPDMVTSTRKKAFLAGAAMKEICADAFHVRSNA